jgi:Bacterial protein of unknown function (DUF885)
MTALAGFFDSYYRLRPVNATFTGVHAHDGRLPDWSPDGLAAAVAEMRGLHAALNSCATHDTKVAPVFGPADATHDAEVAQVFRPADTSLADVVERDRQLALSFLDVQLAEHDCLHFQRGNPSLAVGEVAFGLISLMTRPFADVETRARAAVARLTATPPFLDGARRSIVDGVVDEWRAKCLRECMGVDRLLRDGIATWIAEEHIPAPLAGDLMHAAARAGAAVDLFRTWLVQDAGSAPEERLAIGSDLFDLLLERGHWCERSRRDLAAEVGGGLDEAIARLHERAAQVAPGGWREVQQRLAEGQPSPDRYLAAYQEIWDACRQRATDLDIVAWPDYPIRYVEIPAHTRDAAPFLYYLHYRSPAPFDRLAVHDYVVPPAANTSVIKLNHVVHHGAIGHHVQNYYAYCGPSEIGRVAAVDCASRIGMFLGGTMAEGWACYATDLMEECGFLTPEESVSQQHTRARLLARAVVDIGLHERSLTFEQAIAIYRDRVGMPQDAARAEACKNSMFPGTAVMYWLGTDGLHRLRRERARVEGSAFSLRRFHEQLLSFGSIPVPLIARVSS